MKPEERENTHTHTHITPEWREREKREREERERREREREREIDVLISLSLFFGLRSALCSRAWARGNRVKERQTESILTQREAMADEGETSDCGDNHNQNHNGDGSQHRDSGDDVFGECNDLSSMMMMSMEERSFLDDLLKGTPNTTTHACTHTHTCNPPGPSNLPHTHTCVHTHSTLLFTSHEHEEGTTTTTGDSETLMRDSLDHKFHSSDTCVSRFPKKRPLGNREAVKKYREKKKAHISFLEEQVQQLRSLNQQLMKRLQGQAALEAEVSRLRNVLAEFRGRIDGELGGIQHPKDSRIMRSLHGGYVLNSFSVPCSGTDVPCPYPLLNEERMSSPVQNSVFSCQKANTSCDRKPEARKRKSATTNTMGSVSVADYTD